MEVMDTDDYTPVQEDMVYVYVTTTSIMSLGDTVLACCSTSNCVLLLSTAVMKLYVLLGIQAHPCEQVLETMSTNIGGVGDQKVVGVRLNRECHLLGDTWAGVPLLLQAPSLHSPAAGCRLRVHCIHRIPGQIPREMP